MASIITKWYKTNNKIIRMNHTITVLLGCCCLKCLINQFQIQMFLSSVYRFNMSSQITKRLWLYSRFKISCTSYINPIFQAKHANSHEWVLMKYHLNKTYWIFLSYYYLRLQFVFSSFTLNIENWFQKTYLCVNCIFFCNRL